MILVRALFPSAEKLEDLFAQSYRDSASSSRQLTSSSSIATKSQASYGDREKFESAFEGFTTGDEEDDDDTKVEIYQSLYKPKEYFLWLFC